MRSHSLAKPPSEAEIDALTSVAQAWYVRHQINLGLHVAARITCDMPAEVFAPDDEKMEAAFLLGQMMATERLELSEKELRDRA